jgi:hypothetical protein
LAFYDARKFASRRKIVLPRANREAIIVFVSMEIMSANSSRFAHVAGLLCCIVVANASTAVATELVLQKVPPLTVEQVPAYPQNLARYHFGAQVEVLPESNPIASLQLSSNSEDKNVAEAALLCDDPTTGYALSNGTTTLLISLSKIENIDSVSFLNNGARGQVTIAVSSAKLPASSGQWRKVAQQDLSGDVVKAEIGPSDAKYVKLTFNVSQSGRIASLGVYSTPAISDFTAPRAGTTIPDQSENVRLVSYNLTDVHTKARALYVSSGTDLTKANSMIDEQPATAYSFAANDAAPAAVIDLGKEMSVRRISAIYSPRQGMIDFYVLQNLPAAQPDRASPKSLHLSESTVANMTPVGSVADNGTGRAAIDFPSVTGRYILVKWTPATTQDAPFAIAEIAAFSASANSGSLTMAANTMSSAGYESDGKDAKDVKDFKEAKEMPEEGPAEGPPPTLPDPPPFVFVPEIVPTSP